MKLDKSIIRALALITQLGINVMVPVFMCVFFGVFIQSRFQIKVVIPLLVLGLLAGGRNAYILAMHVAKDSSPKDGRHEKRRRKEE